MLINFSGSSCKFVLLRRFNANTIYIQILYVAEYCYFKNKATAVHGTLYTVTTFRVQNMNEYELSVCKVV